MRKRLPVIAACVAVGLVAAVGVATAAQAASKRQLAGSVPSWASSSKLTGAAPGTDHVGFRVYLGWQKADALAQLATAVATPGSASYRQFLTPQQFRAKYAPSQADVSSVQKWLRDAGFTVDYTPANGHYVAAEGTVAQAQAAFGATIGLYQHGDLVLHAPETALQVPGDLPAVAAVVGLDDSAALVTHSAPPAPAFVNGRPCSAYWGEKTTTNTATLDGTKVPGDYPYAPCGTTPSQVRSAYGLGAADTGAGQTVAIIDAYASPTIADDVDQYSTLHGLPTMNGGQFQQVVSPGTFKRPVSGAKNPIKGPVQDPQGWYGEETLDVEAVHSVAPGSGIVYVGAPNNYQDLDAALNHVVDQHLASIVTNSYGFSSEALPTGYIKPYNDTFLQAAVTGIGLFFSSGDDGDETGGDPANAASATPDWPASSPWVTAVGGTSLGVGASGQYLFETGWETGRSTLTKGAFTPPYPGAYLYGSGGGTSRLFAQPAYQAGVVPASLATAHGSTPARVVPDISALGDPTTGLLVGQTQTFPDGSVRYSEYRIGGTSLSSPLMAGFFAVAQQKAGKQFGFANPLIYAQAGSSAYHDVVQPAAPLGAVRSDYVNGVDDTDGYRYTLRSLSFDSGLTIHTRPGYDDVTGVGTPDGPAFLAKLAS
jgi:subtilase family serine protease